MVWQGKYSKVEVNAGFIYSPFSHDDGFGQFSIKPEVPVVYAIYG
jgi:hypothetical protein